MPPKYVRWMCASSARRSRDQPFSCRKLRILTARSRTILSSYFKPHGEELHIIGPQNISNNMDPNKETDVHLKAACFQVIRSAVSVRPILATNIGMHSSFSLMASCWKPNRGQCVADFAYNCHRK